MKGGEVIRKVRVRELTGKHEEALARALQPAPGSELINWAHFMQVLLESGVEQIGDVTDPQKIKELLQDMLTGDRDSIVLGIRQTTYDDELDLPFWVCPACGKPTPITLNLSEEVEIHKLDDPREATFEVPMRKGRTATVRLVTGRDEAAMYADPGLTQPERDSIMLSKCLVKITDANGQETVVAGFAQTIVMTLSIPDRKAIVRELNKRQPGPRYNEITFVHQDCQKEVPLVIGLGNLFPDLF